MGSLTTSYPPASSSLRKKQLTRPVWQAARPFEDSIAFLRRADLIQSMDDPRGEVLYYAVSRLRALDIYRNSISHYLATASFLARSILRGASDKEVREDAETWHELFYREFFVPSDDALRTRCERLLDYFDEGIGPETPVEVDAETLERLRDLGYLR